MNGIILNWHKYTYFPYEKSLALREVRSLVGDDKIESSEQGVFIKKTCNIESLKRLAYFSNIYDGIQKIPTRQTLFENGYSKEIKSRQQTRYSSHGIHEYKGKFNPQVVLGLINILRIEPGDKILDPFCGSGTTLLECKHQGISATGWDLNPLAVKIANAKIDALDLGDVKLSENWNKLWDSFNNHKSKYKFEKNTPRIEYLQKWIPGRYLLDYELLNELCDRFPSKISNIFKIILSNRIRDFSYQEPADLRIRRRKTQLPKQNLEYLVKKDFSNLMYKIKTTNEVLGKTSKKTRIKAICTDSRILNKKKESNFKAIITSPPYSTALPYIDTQRLSLVWLRLCPPSEIRKLDSSIIGSREFNNKTKREWLDSLKNNAGELPTNLHDYCIKLYQKLGKGDGFRRQALPLLVYRYLIDMKEIFTSLLDVTVSRAKVAMIVGYNHSTLGGKRVNIDTPQLLLDVAKEAGWNPIENTPLESYQRYGLHHHNGVAKEALIMVEKDA